MGFTRKKIGAMITPTFPPASPEAAEKSQGSADNLMDLKVFQAFKWLDSVTFFRLSDTHRLAPRHAAFQAINRHSKLFRYSWRSGENR
ncbi:hypothetical protein NVV30_19900 [Pseudomonas syringae]|uniref:hypothetical protein n=1 Tax=Pseudomonas syringae group TaxID=136849 RepID=UPI000464B1D2|nr:MULTISPECIES: hypothetical protein [Pseudomonas syringae group]MCR8720946.1 hypothetical protein [Pseudomonas syringae]